jgi:hypothetical protein
VAVYRCTIVNGPIENRFGHDVSFPGLTRPGHIHEEFVSLAILGEILLGNGSLEAVITKALNRGS